MPAAGGVFARRKVAAARQSAVRHTNRTGLTMGLVYLKPPGEAMNLIGCFILIADGSPDAGGCWPALPAAACVLKLISPCLRQVRASLIKAGEGVKAVGRAMELLNPPN